MLYYIVTVFVLLFSSVNCQAANDTDIAINGTEFRGMCNDTLFGRLDYWSVDMTKEMVVPRMI